MAGIMGKRYLHQSAVYWSPGGVDGAGNPTYLPPVEIKCRWERTAQLYVNKNNQQVASKSIIIADRELRLDGVLVEGTLNLILFPLDPFRNPGAEVIQQVGKIPNRRATKYLHQYYT